MPADVAKSIVGEEIKVVLFALVQYEKSVLRAAAKPGQPENVAAEFRKTAASIANLIRKLSS